MAKRAPAERTQNKTSKTSTRPVTEIISGFFKQTSTVNPSRVYEITGVTDGLKNLVA